MIAAAALSLLIGTGILYYELHRERRGAAPDALPPPVPLTSYPGFQWSPTFSPDGTRIAFTWDEPRKRPSNIYVKLIGPTEPVRLTFGEDSDFAPAWSPDGRWIAFLRSTGPFSSSVMLIPSLGGQPRELARLQLHAARLVYHGWWGTSPPFLAWSSDSRWLLTLEQSDSGRPTRETPVRITRISVDSGEKRRFLLSLDVDRNQSNKPPSFDVWSGAEGLAVSPNGKKLAFLHTFDDPKTRVYVVALTDEMMPGAPPVSLRFDKSMCQGIAWDEDGRSLIVSSDRRGAAELWRVPIGGSSAPYLIRVSGENPAELAIAKAGRRLAYTHDFHDMNIWRVALTSAHLDDTAAFITSTRDELHPSYSADGKRIAFESDRFGNEEIWVSDADASHAVQVTSLGNAYAGTPSWSPDGQRIAFDSNATGQWAIHVIPSQGGKPTLFTSGSESKIRPSWSHDGQWIYYCASANNGHQIWKKPAIGGREL